MGVESGSDELFMDVDIKKPTGSQTSKQPTINKVPVNRLNFTSAF